MNPLKSTAHPTFQSQADRDMWGLQPLSARDPVHRRDTDRAFVHSRLPQEAAMFSVAAWRELQDRPRGSAWLPLHS